MSNPRALIYVIVPENLLSNHHLMRLVPTRSPANLNLCTDINFWSYIEPWYQHLGQRVPLYTSFSYPAFSPIGQVGYVAFGKNILRRGGEFLSPRLQTSHPTFPLSPSKLHLWFRKVIDECLIGFAKIACSSPFMRTWQDRTTSRSCRLRSILGIWIS